MRPGGAAVPATAFLRTPLRSLAAMPMEESAAYRRPASRPAATIRWVRHGRAAAPANKGIVVQTMPNLAAETRRKPMDAVLAATACLRPSLAARIRGIWFRTSSLAALSMQSVCAVTAYQRPGPAPAATIHGNIDGMLMPCFDAYGEHDNPKEGCPCGENGPHLEICGSMEVFKEDALIGRAILLCWTRRTSVIILGGDNNNNNIPRDGTRPISRPGRSGRGSRGAGERRDASCVVRLGG